MGKRITIAHKTIEGLERISSHAMPSEDSIPDTYGFKNKHNVKKVKKSSKRVKSVKKSSKRVKSVKKSRKSGHNDNGEFTTIEFINTVRDKIGSTTDSDLHEILFNYNGRQFAIVIDSTPEYEKIAILPYRSTGVAIYEFCPLYLDNNIGKWIIDDNSIDRLVDKFLENYN